MSFDERDRPRSLDPGQAFLPLEPPPAGLAALRRRLDGRASLSRPRRWLPATALATLAAAVLIVVARAPRRGPSLLDQAAPEQTLSLVGLGLAAPPVEPVTSARGNGAPLHLRRVPVNTPSVVLYLARPDRSGNAADRR
jgi:hypothetical protein